MKTLSVTSAIQSGWQKVNEKMGFWISFTLLYFIVSGTLRAGTKWGHWDDDQAATVLLSLVNLIISNAFGIVATKNILNQYKGNALNYWQPFTINLFLKYFIMTVLIVFFIAVGFLLLVIPGIIVIVRLSQSWFLLIDKDIDPIDAMKRSWEMTKGNGWNIFLYFVACVLIIILGIICLIVGILVAMPVIWLASGYIYTFLSSEQSNNVSSEHV